jgi:hypothetical protein
MALDLIRLNEPRYSKTPNSRGNNPFFVRPHSALDGKTPAEMAGVGIGGENKWMGLLEKSTKKGV